MYQLPAAFFAKSQIPILWFEFFMLLRKHIFNSSELKYTTKQRQQPLVADTNSSQYSIKIFLQNVDGESEITRMKWKRRLMERTMKCHVVKRTNKVNSYFNLNENQQFDSLNSRLVWRRGDVFLHVDAIAYKQIHVQQTNSHTFASVWCPWQCVLCVASIVTIFHTHAHTLMRSFGFSWLITCFVSLVRMQHSFSGAARSECVT